jgi:hypothetical protein
MGFLSKLFGKKESTSPTKVSTPIKKIYSFVGTSIPLDTTTPMGNAFIKQILPFAYQNLLKGNTEFNQLFNQAVKENCPQVIGAGSAVNNEGLTIAFNSWLKEARGANLNDPTVGGLTSLFAGNANHPTSGSPFRWVVYVFIEDGR